MNRCLEIAALLGLATALAGCAGLTPRLAARSVLGGYKLMSAPTAEVPVGAAWRQGYGPVGPPAAAGNLVTRRSFSSLTLSRAERRGLEVKLAEYLGLEPSTNANLSATVTEMSVTSVRDFARLGLKPGDYFLSDAMKASKIIVATSSEAGVDILTSLQARGLPISGHGNADGQETITIEGADLYFAYRVVRLEKNETEGPPLGRVIRRPRAPGW